MKTENMSIEINKNTLPLVTIGIPTYNRANVFLKQALKSVLGQTYPNVEIIVSDNCSTDNTENVVKSFNDPRIRYFKQGKNIGAINNSNFCLEQARGDYYLLHHDDDLIDPDFLETCMKAANYSTKIGIIRTGTKIIDMDDNVLQESRNNAGWLSAEEFFRSWFAMKNSIYLCSTVFNTKELRKIGGFKSIHNLFDDVVAIARLSQFPRVDVEEIKAGFRKHGGEETFAARTRDWCEDSLYALDIICDLVAGRQDMDFRNEGLRFFSAINYGFADKIKSPAKRLNAYFEIYKMFGYRHLPPPVKKLFMYMNPVHDLRLIRNRIKKLSF